MIVVYIASPYTVGDISKNVRAQIDMADKLALLGYIPRWPTASHFWHVVHPHDYEFWMDLDLKEITRCDALLRLPGESPGGDREVRHAQRIGVPVFFSVEELLANITA